MAVVNTKSTQVSNGDASPPVLNPTYAGGGGVLRRLAGTVEVAAADDDTSVFRMGRVHSSWVMNSIIILNDALTSGTSYDVGLHDIAAAGGAVVDADLFGDAVDLSSARKATGGVEVRFDRAGSDLPDLNKPIWELLALSVDPGKWYDLTLTANTIGSAAGTISLIATYCTAD